MHIQLLTSKRTLSSLLTMIALLLQSFLTVGFIHVPGSSASSPVVIIVTSTDDVLASDGVCTLREAIIAANTNTPSGERDGECRAGKENEKDIISLANNATYSLTIDSTSEDDARDGDLDIWDNSSDTDLFIGVQNDGQATISQDASVDDRVLDVLGANVKIKGLTLSGGNALDSGGGGVQNTGTLTINSSSILGNNGPGAGGGILNFGTLKLDVSVISGNSSLDGGGGGIWNNGVLKITASTLSNNVASGGGGLFNDGGAANINGGTEFTTNIAHNEGGAIVNTGSGTLTVQDSLLSGNQAADSNEEDGNWESCGGLQNQNMSTATITNTVITNNSASWNGAGVCNDGNLTVNLTTISDNTGTGDGGGLLNTGSLEMFNSNVSSNSAGWGAGLNNMWGSTTLKGSTISSNTATETGGGLANWGGTLVVESSTLSGNQAPSAGGIQNYGGGTGIIISSVLSGNAVTSIGGGVVNDSDLKMQSSIISNNTADFAGGGLYNFGTLTIQNGSEISSNTASRGGGLFNDTAGTVSLSDSTISGNSVPYGGGGLHNRGQMTVSMSTIADNQAGWGGGIMNFPNSQGLVVENSVVKGNGAETVGGGIYNLAGMTITGSALLTNESDGEGDAIYSEVAAANATSVTESCIVGNGDTAFFNGLDVPQQAISNWWGAASGPRGEGTGFGDSVGGNVDFSSWLTTPLDICPTVWVAAYTYDLPAGTWSEGEHRYHFEAEWNGGGEVTADILFNVSSLVPSYDGFVLLRPGAVRAGIEGECPAIDAIQPGQQTRFLVGYPTDSSMTYKEALGFFASLSARAIWDDGMSAELTGYEIIPFQEDEWFQHVCTFTK